MDKCGVVLLGEDKQIGLRAKREGLPVVVDVSMPLAFEKTLFVAPGVSVPWDLLPAAWHFLDRWDAAVPLWRYGVLAEQLGTPSERKRTAAVVRDLRVLVHAVELLFVRSNADGKALVESYRKELGDGGERRLAFLRAVYTVKPRLCVLPVTWMAEIQQRAEQDARVLRQSPNAGKRLVEVEITPGRWVKCYQGDEARVREQFGNRMKRRH
jgi:hypothetical protein